MSYSGMKEELISEFKRFLNWEQQSFEGWETVQVFISNTLSEAWILARPEDAYKFEDPAFKQFVDSANGKWLEKKSPNDPYKVIMSTKHFCSSSDMMEVFVHEMRHCLDYRNAVCDLPFAECHPGNRYYNNWSEFRAVYAQTRYAFFSRCVQTGREKDGFRCLAGILGEKTADCVAGIMRSQDDLHSTLYYISRYIGAARAVRDLNIQTGINEAVFHLWNMTPQYIIENYGYVFYIGNKWEAMHICGLDAVPDSYYSDLVAQIKGKGN